jgi:hypothetical protein
VTPTNAVLPEISIAADETRELPLPMPLPFLRGEDSLLLHLARVSVMRVETCWCMYCTVCACLAYVHPPRAGLVISPLKLVHMYRKEIIVPSAWTGQTVNCHELENMLCGIYSDLGKPSGRRHRLTECRKTAISIQTLYNNPSPRLPCLSALCQTRSASFSGGTSFNISRCKQQQPRESGQRPRRPDY